MREDRVRFAHVARHLYRATERWEQVVPEIGRDSLDRACAAGCARPDIRARHPDCDCVSDGCRSHVLRDHDVHLEPAYRRALASAEDAGRIARSKKRARCWGFVGDRGVFAIVREVSAERRPEVKTAYRVLPPRRSAGSVDDFCKAAVRKLSDKSSWTMGGE